MPPKPLPIPKLNEKKRSVIVIPSRVISRPDQREGGEETEIAAQISIPQDGGWSWIVLFSAFLSIFILDGVSFTFGSIYSDMIDDLGMEESLIALINSIAVSLYFMVAPIASALINRFGFRACAMTGAVIDTFALLCAYFSTNYGTLCITYGGFAGVGYSFINMSSSLVVGFYFEKLRSLALSLATMGSSLGVMIMFPINMYLTTIAGWRVLTLLHSGLFAIIFFLGMSYKPLLSLTVMKATDDATRTVTYLPSLSSVRPTLSKTKAEGLTPTATEKLFSAVSNMNFPTAADMIDDRMMVAPAQAGPSAPTVPKLTLTAHAPRGGLSQRQINQVRSILSRTSVQDKKKNVELTVNESMPKKQRWWTRLFHWESHIQQSRPMYRDDVFYDGKLKSLPVYQKSILDTIGEPKTGLEYQLAVSRAVTVGELQEHRGVFTTAARRVLATMMDPALLKRNSFLLLCICAFLTYLGYLVPYVYISDRNEQAGIDPVYCSWFVSIIALANAIGRLVLGALAGKVNSLKLFIISTVAAGVSTMLSNASYNVYYQYLYCFVYGFFIAANASARSMVIVELYGLERLTNATGILFLFQGVGSLLCTPIASAVKITYGYALAYYLAGFFITLGSVCLMPIKFLCNKEIQKMSRVQEIRNK